MGDNMNKKSMTIKDLVTTGIFSALFLIFSMVGSILFAPNPVLTFLTPLASALFTGPIYLLLVAKVPKRGPIIILGLLMGIVFFVTGMYWTMSVSYILLGFIADIIAKNGKYKDDFKNTLSFMFFSLSTIGSYVMLWINQNAYIKYLTDRGTDRAFMDTMISTMQSWMLPGMILGTLLTAFISAAIGKKLLKKQFEKAGVLK